LQQANLNSDVNKQFYTRKCCISYNNKAYEISQVQFTSNTIQLKVILNKLTNLTIQKY